jgi:tetratricopeptide (TPR) repeat protein
MKKNFLVIMTIVIFTFSLSLFGSAEKKLSSKAQKAMNEAFAAIKARKADEAIASFKKVIELEPEYAIPYFNIGVIYSQTGKTVEAVPFFEEAVKHQPDYDHAVKALHKSLYELGVKANTAQEYEKSNGYLQKLLARPGIETADKVKAINAAYVSGVNFYYLKKFKEAAETFAKSLVFGDLEQENFPIFSNIIYFQGMNYHQLSQYGESNKYFLRFLDLYKGGDKTSDFLPQAWFFAGTNLYLELEPKISSLKEEELTAKAREIEPYFQKALELRVPVENAYVMLGNLYAYEKNYEPAQKTYAELVALYPQSPDIAKYKAFLEKLEAIIKQQKQDAAKAAKKLAKKK